MKKFTLTAVSVLAAGFVATAQSVDGLEYGSYYSKGDITSILHRTQESVSDNGFLVFKSGKSTFSFDFTSAYESVDGRFVGIDICDAGHVVKLPLGEFKVGDTLEQLLYFRGDMEFLAFEGNLCRLSCLNKGGKKVSVMLEYDDNMVITRIREMAVSGKKDGKADKKGKFFNAVPVVETAGINIQAGDPLSKLLTLEVDIEFSPYGNGICCITNERLHEAYLIRYDMQHIVKEILLF